MISLLCRTEVLRYNLTTGSVIARTSTGTIGFAHVGCALLPRTNDLVNLKNLLI